MKILSVTSLSTARCKLSSGIIKVLRIYNVVYSPPPSPLPTFSSLSLNLSLFSLDQTQSIQRFTAARFIFATRFEFKFRFCFLVNDSSFYENEFCNVN